jgi:hypothetical protein
MELAEAAVQLQTFADDSLTRKLSHVETTIKGLTSSGSAAFVSGVGASQQALEAAATIKQLASQIDVTIHALGILRCLPHLLQPGEVVEYVSLGAGNTGRQFDLETNLRVAEFKFINWKGGSESIRQNGIFKDFCNLAEYPTPKLKYLYLLGTGHALKFFQGGRALGSVMSKDKKLYAKFLELHGDRFATVQQYFSYCAGSVSIEDVGSLLEQT